MRTYFLRLGFAVLLARRPTLVLPLARAALANFARAADCCLVAIGVPLCWRGYRGGELADNPSTRPGDRLGCAVPWARRAVAVCAAFGSSAALGTALAGRLHEVVVLVVVDLDEGGRVGAVLNVVV